MKSNYDHSKTIIRKTTKYYLQHADDPLLLIICRHISIEALKRGLKAIEFLDIILYTENMPYHADWSILLVVYP